MSIQSSFSLFSGRRRAFLLLSAFAVVALCSGCGRMRRLQPEKVYVAAREAYLRDRLAAVSNRTGKVVNGEQLIVLEHGRRFTRVKTPQNQTGWIEDHMVIDQAAYDAFAQLASQHRDDSVIATATLNDDLYMHLTPGRSTPRFYLLLGNTQVQLLQRASVLRNPSAGSAASQLARLARPANPAARPAAQKAAESSMPPPPAPMPVPMPAPMEDWWLVRDSQGRTGWMLASRLYVNVPDAIEQYGEGQNFVGAWKIASIDDPDSSVPGHQVPEYLTLMAPPHSGLPYDFDQIRVFTWSRLHHRYETGFRLHPIRGYLPVKIFTAQTPQGPVPAFSFLLATSDNVSTDPDTGVVHPVAPRTIQYEVIGTVVRRIGPDQAPIDTHRDEASAQERKQKQRAEHPARQRR